MGEFPLTTAFRVKFGALAPEHNEIELLPMRMVMLARIPEMMRMSDGPGIM